MSKKIMSNKNQQSDSTKTLIVVESPTKIKTITKYVGNNYVLASTLGHLRQIPSKSDSVTWDGQSFHFSWELDKKKFSGITKSMDNIGNVLIATDPDREGEAIGWHLKTLLEEKYPNLHIQRITFNEITKKAVNDAINNPRDINNNLVNAYFARVGLDYTVGFTLSPLLWTKMPLKNVSAGRVQTPTLGFIVEREIERINFKSTKYYQIIINLKHNDLLLETQVCKYNDQNIPQKLEDYELANEIYNTLPKKFKLKSIDSKIITLSPPVPFVTSSLQQEGNRLLNIKIQQVMQLAQNLYEGLEIDGVSTALITYMRTDSMTMSDDSINSIRDFLCSKNYANDIPKTPNKFKNKAKNIQEAHECIRPVNINITPSSIKGKISDLHYKLYELIWSRSVACQMNPAQREQSKYIFNSENHELKYTNSTIKYKGYLNFYNNCSDNDYIEIPIGQEFENESSKIHTQETKPPARYNEASLIQQMEQEGIGRPSTYSSILSTLFKREFIYEQGKQIIPTVKGSIVFFFMKTYFSQFIQTEFTSYAETILDDITNGTTDHIPILNNLINDLNTKSKSLEKYVFEPIGNIVVAKYQKSCSNCQNNYQLRYKNDFFLHCLNCKTNIPFFPPTETILNDNITKFIYYKESGLCYLAHNEKRFYLPKHFNFSDDNDYKFVLELPKSFGIINGNEVVSGVTQYGFFLKYNEKYYTINFDNLKTLKNNEVAKFLNV